MVAGAVSPPMALAMISEGTEQVIQVDHRTMLKKVMESLRSRDAPEYTVYDCGSRGVRVCVKLNVSCARFSVVQKLTSVEIEGDTTNSRLLAEKTAILKAFKHLNDKHLVKIRDYSSRVAHDLDTGTYNGYLIAAVHNVEHLIQRWQVVMDKCEDIAVQVGAKEGAAKVHGDPDGQGQVYEAVKMNMEMIVEMYKGQITQARERTNDIESECKKYHTKKTETYQAALRKGYMQDAFLESKHVLDYVLTYIGSGRASYSNGPTDDGMMEGVVVFNIPDLPCVEYCGNITIRGKSTRSRDAEEDAAFRALRYMENKFNLKIVDLNHVERVDAEKDQKLLIRLLDRIVYVGDDINKYWGKMTESIATERRVLAVDPQALYAAPAADAAKKAEASKECANTTRAGGFAVCPAHTAKALWHTANPSSWVAVGDAHTAKPRTVMGLLAHGDFCGTRPIFAVCHSGHTVNPVRLTAQ